MDTKNHSYKLYRKKYKDIYYRMPKRKYAAYELTEIDISYGIQHITDIKQEGVFYYKGNNDSLQVCLTMELGCCYNPKLDSLELGIFLYKEDIEEPVLILTEKPDNILNLKFNFGNEIVRSGKYFIFFDNLEDAKGDNILYPFQIVNDESFSAKDVRTVHMIQLGSSEDIHQLSKKLILKINFWKLIDSLQNFSLSCYNKQWRLMCKCDDVCASPSPNKALLQTRLTSPHFWTEGEYFIIFSKKNIPILKINFHLTAQRKIECQFESIENEYEYNILTNFLEKDKCWTDGLQAFPGLAAIRHKIVQHPEIYVFNKYREKYDLKPVCSYNHFLLTGKDNGYNYKIFCKIIELLDSELDTRRCNLQQMIKSRNNNKEEDEKFYLRCEEMVYIDQLSELFSGKGNMILSEILDTLRNNYSNSVLVFSGTEAEIKQLFDEFPELKDYFPPQNHFQVESFSIDDILYLIKESLKSEEIELVPESWIKLYKYLCDEAGNGRLGVWDKIILGKFIQEKLINTLRKKVFEIYKSTHANVSKHLTTIYPDDIELSIKIHNVDSSFAQSIAQLDAMIGLENVKQNIKNTFSWIQFNRSRAELGLPFQKESPHHMIFTGNPGTGKTTVAKLIGKIYHSLGILSKGDVIVTERSKLVGQWIGETEKNVTEVLRMAKGNVLFIDEAYTLCDSKKDRRDFGYRVIESLLTVLAQENPDMIVVLAGYETEMNLMMDCNIGLKGRFPYKLNFADYSVDELLLIGKSLFDKEEYILTAEAQKLWHTFIFDTYENRDKYFSNARWITQMIKNELLHIVAKRILHHPDMKNRKFYQTIEKEDIFDLIHKNKTPQTIISDRPRIGFCA